MKNLIINKQGFTLAEVLITIAIIGVVTVLTIPTLVQKYQKYTWDTNADVFEKKLEQALRVMNTQGVLGGHKTTEKFVKELKNHFNITKICSTPSDCFEKAVEWDDRQIKISHIKTGDLFTKDEWNTNVVGIQFANGITGMLAYNPNCVNNPNNFNTNVMDCIALMYDTTGHSNPNQASKDIRTTDNVRDFGCVMEIQGICVTRKPFVPNAITKEECEALIEQGYGIESCPSNIDYWAGAVKTCGGVEFMADMSQLKSIVGVLYPDGNLDRQKAEEYGFKIENDTIYLWSSEEHQDSEWSPTAQTYYGTTAYWGTRSTKREYGTADKQIVCVN